MKIAISVLQTMIALGLLNVWLLRRQQSSEYRGGDAKSMQEEFAAYGLPQWSMWLVGMLKVAAALCLIAGLWFHFLTLPSATLICVLMVGALAMHLKVHDEAKKYLPAALILIFAMIVCVWAPR